MRTGLYSIRGVHRKKILIAGLLGTQNKNEEVWMSSVYVPLLILWRMSEGRLQF